MVMDFDPESMRVHVIDNLLMHELRNIFEDTKKYNTSDIDKLENIFTRIYQKNCDIYNNKNEYQSYNMTFTGVKYHVPYPGDSRLPWKQEEYQYGHFIDIYTGEKLLDRFNLKEINVPQLNIFEDKIQIMILVHNKDSYHNTVHMIIFTFPISTLFDMYNSGNIIECDNKECDNKECSCKSHVYYNRYWCTSCFKESYKAEFMYKEIFGAINSSFQLDSKYFFKELKKSKYLDLKLYRDVYKLKKYTIEDYLSHFKDDLEHKTKKLEQEYELAKKFLRNHPEMRKEPEHDFNELLNSPLSAYEYFDKLKYSKGNNIKESNQESNQANDLD